MSYTEEDIKDIAVRVAEDIWIDYDIDVNVGLLSSLIEDSMWDSMTKEQKAEILNIQ